MSFNNVSIVKRQTHYAVYKGRDLVGVSPTFAGAWDLAKTL